MMKAGTKRTLKWVLIGGGIAAVLIISFVKGMLSKISYSYANLKPGKVTIDNMEIVLDVNIHNANTFGIPIPVLKGDILAGGKIVGQVKPVGFVIPASGIVKVPLTFSLVNKLLTGQLLTLAMTGSVVELLDGFVIAWKVTTKWGTYGYTQKLGVE